MFFDFNKLFNWSYLVEPNPGASFSYLVPVLIFIGLLFAVAIFLPLIIKKETKSVPIYFVLGKKISHLFAINAITLLLLVFFRIEAIQILSMRVLFYIDLLVFIIWSLVIVVWAKKNIKKEVSAYEEKQRIKKYLPKSKK